DRQDEVLEDAQPAEADLVQNEYKQQREGEDLVRDLKEQVAYNVDDEGCCAPPQGRRDEAQCGRVGRVGPTVGVETLDGLFVIADFPDCHLGSSLRTASPQCP